MKRSILSALFCISAVGLCFHAAHAQPLRAVITDPPGSSDYIFAKINEKVPEFAGFWFESDRVTIGLTRLTSAAKTKAANYTLSALHRRPTEASNVKFKLVPNSFANLQTVRKRIKRLLGSDRKITFLDTDERANIVVVGLANLKDEPGIRKIIKDLGVDDTFVKFERRPVFKPMDGQDVLRQRYRPLMGGIQIFPGCTLGLPVLLGGVRGVLTNSHCTRLYGILDGTVFFQRDNTPGDRIGVETVDADLFPSTDTNECPAGLRCRYADAAFVRLDDNVGAKRGWIKNTGTGTDFAGDYEVNGVVPFGACGTRVLKIGARTGKTYGEVEHTCADGWVEEGPDDPNRAYYLCQDVIGAGSGDGDSGSPVITQTNQSKTRFYGLLWGGTSEESGVTPVWAILMEIGLIDVMPGNDAPRIRITSPLSGTSFGMGVLKTLKLEANVFDPEGKNCGASGNTCTVTWTSNLDGELGTGTSIDVGFTTPGARAITATVRDGQHTVADQIAVFVTSNPPNVDIVLPGGTLYKGLPYLLYARATDSDVALLQQVACSRFFWNSNRTEDRGTFLPKQSCKAIARFDTVGQRNLSVTATDPQGDAATEMLTVDVVPMPASGPPIISMLVSPHTSFKPNATASLRASIIDPDHGNELSYKWKIKYGSTEKVIFSRKVHGFAHQLFDPWRSGDHVPNQCGGWPTVLTLEVTDKQGQESSQSVNVYVPYPLC